MNVRNSLSKRNYRITFSNAHRVLLRQKNFETLAKDLFVQNKKRLNITQEALNHGKKIRALLQGKSILML